MRSPKPKQLGDIKRWHRCTIAISIVYIVCGLALISSIIIFLFRRSCWPQALPVSEWLDQVIQQKALVAVGSAVGATAIVIAWLINVTGQTVCGERIGILAGWAYPFFFRYYFFVFLITFFAGIYVGNADTQRLPTLIITMGLGIGAIFIGRVCYVFVLDFKGRERVAYTYYDHQFQYKPGMDINSFKLNCERAILRITNHTVHLEESGEDIPHGTIYALWTTCIENYRMASGDFAISDGGTASKGTAGRGDPGLNASCCSLAEQFWARLLPARQQTLQHLDFLLYLNYREKLDAGRTKTESELSCEEHLLAGLLLQLAQEHEAGDRPWDKECTLLFDIYARLQDRAAINPSPLTFCKLLWGVAWMMTIDSAVNHTKARFSTIHEIFKLAHIDIAENGTTSAEQIGDFLKKFANIYYKEFGHQTGAYGCSSDGQLQIGQEILKYLYSMCSISGLDVNDAYAVVQRRMGKGLARV